MLILLSIKTNKQTNKTEYLLLVMMNNNEKLF